MKTLGHLRHAGSREHPRLRGQEARIAALPPAHRDVAHAVLRYLAAIGATVDRDDAARIVHDLADLFERAAFDETSLRDLVGTDPADFADALASSLALGPRLREERRRLAISVDLAVAAVPVP